MIKIHLNIHHNLNIFKYSSNRTVFFVSQNPLVVFIAPCVSSSSSKPTSTAASRTCQKVTVFVCFLVGEKNCTTQTLAYCVQPHFLLFTCYLPKKASTSLSIYIKYMPNRCSEIRRPRRSRGSAPKKLR